MIRHRDRYTDLKGSCRAMIRAASNAAELARRHNQPLLLWRDGRIARVMPDDLPPLPDIVPPEEILKDAGDYGTSPPV